MVSFASQFRRWFDYEKDSHAKVLSSLTAVPEPQRGTKEFQQAATLLAHIIAARELWLHRLGAAPDGPREFFPKDVSLTDLAGRLEKMESAWSIYLLGVDDAALAGVFEYRSQEG